MNRFWVRVEEINQKLIPMALVVLLLIIADELFWHPENNQIQLIVKILDIGVIAIFVIDLIFLGVRAKNTQYFFKHYWLDLLAIFPLGLVFNGIERLYRAITAAEEVVVGQAILHEGLEIRKELPLLARSERLSRFARSALRFLKFGTKTTAWKKKRD